MIVKGDKNDQPVTPNQFTVSSPLWAIRSTLSKPTRSLFRTPNLTLHHILHQVNPPPVPTSIHLYHLVRQSIHHQRHDAIISISHVKTLPSKVLILSTPTCTSPQNCLLHLKKGNTNRIDRILNWSVKTPPLRRMFGLRMLLMEMRRVCGMLRERLWLMLAHTTGLRLSTWYVPIAITILLCHWFVYNKTANLLLRPVQIKVTSQNGSASLVIPSTFTGPLSIGSRNGSISISEMIQGRSTSFAEVKGIGSYFVGDFKRAGFGAFSSETR